MTKSRIPSSQRRAMFVAAYLVSLDATKAAIAAGCKAGGSAKSMGSRWLQRPDVLAAIAAAQAKRVARTEITQDRVLRELALLAFSDLDHYLIDDNGRVELAEGAPEGAMRALSSIKFKVTTDDEGRTERTTEIKLWDKPGPLKLAGRHTGLFNERELTREQLEREVDERIAELVRQERERRGQTTAITVTAGRGTNGA